MLLQGRIPCSLHQPRRGSRSRHVHDAPSPRPSLLAGSRRRSPQSTCRAAPQPISLASIDVVGLGNLCVDAVLPVPELPPADPAARAALLARLSAAPPDRSSWEVGGNCNFMVAAARLGLRVASVGHIGGDVYGAFMDEVLQEEGIQATTRIEATAGEGGSGGNGDGAGPGPGSAASASSPSSTPSSSPSPSAASAPVLDATLICFVLVDPHGSHAFCSRYDFGPWPLLAGVRGLPGEATGVLRASRAIFTNGFIFDELPLEVVKGAVGDAIDHGAAIFFDPGPRCQTMLAGPRRAALDMLLDLSCVVLMTEEEALTVTGHADPERAARAVLARPACRARWAVVKMGGEGALLAARGQGPSDVTVTRMGAVKVDVVDTVGCGDSFAAAVVMGYTRGWDAATTLALACGVGGATATGRGAGRNVARADKVLQLLTQGAAAAAPEQRPAFGAARERLLASLAAAGRAEAAGAERQLSAAA